MLSSRLNAFIASQSFLVVGHASSVSASLGRWNTALRLVFLPSLAPLGLMLAPCAWPGIEAAHEVIAGWHAKRDGPLARNAGLARRGAPAAGAPAEDRRRRAVVFAKHAPGVFGIAWRYFGALPFPLHLRG